MAVLKVVTGANPARVSPVHTDWAHCRIYLFGLLLILFQASVGGEQILIWSQHSHKWTKLRGIYGATQQWVQDTHKKFVTGESARDRRINSLAYDHTRRHIYWHDGVTKNIYRQSVNDSLVARLDEGNWELVFEKASGIVGGMAIDWITGNLYWTDQTLKEIRMTRKHPSATDVSRVVVQKGLDTPTNIAVDPVNRRLYWGDAGGSPGISTSDLEGGDTYPLTIPGQVGRVKCLTLDLSDFSIYFVDEQTNLHYLRKLDLGTKTVSDVVTLTGQKFPGIAAHGDYIYVLDDEYLQVQVYDKQGKKLYTYTIDAFPHDIVITDKLNPRWTPPSECDSMGCGDFCIRLGESKAECRCRDKYYFRLDGRNCISSEPRLLYAQGGHVLDTMVDITLASQTARLTPKVLTDTKSFKKIEALGYHFTKDLAYFSDTELDDVYRVEVGKKEFVQITANEYNVEGIAVCWLAETVYWTDSDLRHIMVSHLDGRYHRILLHNVGIPRGITCDAIHGYIFFVDAEAQTIERMYTDGTNRKAIVTGIQEPQSIVVDPRNKRIYWTQRGVLVIHTTDFEGQNKLQAHSATSSPYGVTLFQDFIIWTQAFDHPKIAVNNNGAQMAVSLLTQPASSGETRDIVTFDFFLQPEALGPCLANGGCQQLCFPTPAGASCNCAIGYSLASDGRSCTTDVGTKDYDKEVAETRFLLFVDPFHKAIYQVDLQTDTTRAVPIDKLDFPISIDVDPETGKVFWIDEINQSIRSSYTNGADEKELWKVAEGRKPVKLAYDPQDRMLYFTDMGIGAGGVYAIPRDGGEPKVIIQGLMHPTGLALDTNRRVVYYADRGWTQNEAGVFSVNMDGAQKQTVDKSFTKNPSNLAVLSEEGMLFWSDSSTRQVWNYNITSGSMRAILTKADMEITAISADDTYVYFAARKNKAVHRVPWRPPTPTAQAITQPIFARIYDIKAYPNLVLIPPPAAVVTGVLPVMWIGAGVAAAVLLALILLLAICCARKKPKKKPPPTVAEGFDEDVDRSYIPPVPVAGVTGNGFHNGNGHMGNGYNDEVEANYQNYQNGMHPDGNAPITSSAPELSSRTGFVPNSLADEAAVVMSTGQLRPTKKYQKKKQPTQPLDPNAFEMQGGKVATMVQRLAKRLRTGISSIRWTNGEENGFNRNSQAPDDFENPNDPDADQVGCQKPKYAKRPPIGPFKPQLHRLPQGFAPASRVTPSNVKNTWNRQKKKQGRQRGQAANDED